MGLILAFAFSVCAAAPGDDLLGLPRSLQQQEESKPVPYQPPAAEGPIFTSGAVGRSVFPVTSMARDFGLLPSGASFPNGDLRGTFGWSDFFKVGVGGS